MKRKDLIKNILIINISLISIYIKAQNPTYLLELRNDLQVSATEYEFDIYLLRTGTTTFEYATGQYGILVNPSLKDGGTITASVVPGSPDPILVASGQTWRTIDFYAPFNVIRISGKVPPGAGYGALISNVSPGTRICRVRLTKDIAFGQYQPNLTWTQGAYYLTDVFAYVGGSNIKITNDPSHTINYLINPVLSVATSSDSYINDDFKLRIYPNPFNDRTTIDYKLLHNSLVRLAVFDTNGRQVEMLVDENQQAGSYSVQWISSSESEGIYIVKLQAGLTQEISRITLIR